MESMGESRLNLSEIGSGEGGQDWPGRQMGRLRHDLTSSERAPYQAASLPGPYGLSPSEGQARRMRLCS